MLDVEVLDLVGIFAVCDDVEELSETVSLEVLLGEVLEISLGEGDVSSDGDLFVFALDIDCASEFSSSSVDFDSLSEIFGEVVGVKDFIFDGFGAVDGEGS